MDLTPEQKEHVRMAYRSKERIAETWSLYTMFLGDGQTPAEALRRACDAVAVWAEWQDDNEVNMPEIDLPDFGKQISEAIEKLKAHAQEGKEGELRLEVGTNGQGFDAEFVPAEQSSPRSQEAALPSTSELGGHLQPMPKDLS